MRGCSRGRVRHLGAALDLEHADRVGRAEHVVDPVVLGRQRGQVDAPGRGAARTRSNVVCSAVSMPSPSRSNFTSPASAQSSLSHCSTVRSGIARPLHRAHLDHRPVAHHHAAGVDAQVPREVQELGGQVDDLLGDVVVDGVGERAPALDLLGPRVLLAGRVAERPGHVPHRQPRPVGDDVGDLGGVIPPVPLVDVLDDLLAAAGLDVHVDVRRPVPLGGEEPLEQQPVRHRRRPR